MGKVLDVKSDTHTDEIEQEVNRLYFSKNKSDTDHNPDMVVLNEYMEYFESLNTVCRHIVHVQRDVISQVGSNRWVKLSTKEQDETLNKKLINSKCRPSLKDEIGATSDVDWFPRLKSRSGKEPRELLELGNRDSIQSFSVSTNIYLTEFSGLLCNTSFHICVYTYKFVWYRAKLTANLQLHALEHTRRKSK